MAELARLLHPDGVYRRRAIPHLDEPSGQKLGGANLMGLNTQQTVPFKRNSPATVRFHDFYTSDYDIGNLQLKGTDRAELFS